MANVLSKSEATPLCDFMTAAALSIKSDNAPVTSPGNGAVLVAGYDASTSRQRYLNAGTFDNGAADESSISLFVRAAVTGRDLAASANARNVPISSDVSNAITTRTMSTIQNLYTASIIYGAQVGNSTVAQLATVGANYPTAHAYALGRLMVEATVRGDDGATVSAVAARAASTAQVSTLVRLLVDSAPRTLGILSGSWDAAAGVPELSGASASVPGSVAMRAEGYWASRRGRRYVCKSPNITGVAAATALTLTAPTFLIVPGSTSEVIIRRVTVSMPLKGTSTTFRALIKTDTANRFSSGGTARAPGTMNQGNTVASALAQNLEAPTATAESTVVDVACKAGLVADGAVIEFLFQDGLIVPASGSFLLYVITATAGATVDYEIEFEEANIQ